MSSIKVRKVQKVEEKHQKDRELLCKKAFELLANNSWSAEFIGKLEEECDFLSGHAQIIFPQGAAQAVAFFEKRLDDKMLLSLNNIEKPTKIREQIALALEERIINISPKEILAKNSEFFLKPQNICFGSEAAMQSVDTIWRYAGDESTDFNYYSKRGLLLTVYVAARSFYFTDASEDYINTREFIKTALDNVIKIGTLKSKIKMPNKEDIPFFRLFS